MNSLEDCLTRFYKYAIQLQIKQKIKCLDLSKDSIAGKIRTGTDGCGTKVKIEYPS